MRGSLLKNPLSLITSCTCKLSAALSAGNVFYFFPCGKYVNVCIFTKTTTTDLTFHLPVVCIWNSVFLLYVYQQMSTRGKEDLNPPYTSLEIAAISSAVFGVNVTHCNKPEKVNTKTKKEISVNGCCFFFSWTLRTCHYFHAVVIMSSGKKENTIQPLIYTTADQLATSLSNSLFWPNKTVLPSNPPGPGVCSAVWKLGMLSFLLRPLTSSAIQLEQAPWALQCSK